MALTERAGRAAAGRIAQRVERAGFGQGPTFKQLSAMAQETGPTGIPIHGPAPRISGDAPGFSAFPVIDSGGISPKTMRPGSAGPGTAREWRPSGGRSTTGGPSEGVSTPSQAEIFRRDSRTPSGAACIWHERKNGRHFPDIASAILSMAHRK